MQRVVGSGGGGKHEGVIPMHDKTLLHSSFANGSLSIPTHTCSYFLPPDRSVITMAAQIAWEEDRPYTPVPPGQVVPATAN